MSGVLQTALGGGSFLNNLRNSAISDVAAAAAFGIGDSTDPLTLENVAEHAILGCAASAAGGTGCAGGALGAATSAALTPFVIAGLDPNGTPLDPEQAAATTAIALIAGGGAAALLGQNATAGATWAENEAQNNAEPHAAKALAAVTAFLQSARNLVPGVRMADQAQQAANAGNYTTAFALALGSLADAGIGIATLGDSAIAEQAAGKVVSALDGTASVATTTAATGANVWGLNPIVRGVTIESQLAQTEYSAANGWYQVGAEKNGYFPLVDFQNGNTLVSLKTVDTTGSTWLPRMEGVIDQLGSSNATVNGSAANMVLDMRVQPGGTAAAQQLISYGARQGVTVRIKVYP